MPAKTSLARLRNGFEKTLILRHLLFFARVLVLSIAITPGLLQMVLADVPVSGREYPGLEPFDQLMISLLNTWSIPGGVLTVSRNGHVLLSRGYGYADLER